MVGRNMENMGIFNPFPDFRIPILESQFPPLCIRFWNSLRGEQSQGVQCVGKILGFDSSPPLSFLLKNFLGKKNPEASENLILRHARMGTGAVGSSCATMQLKTT